MSANNSREICPACAGPLVSKHVEKLLRGGVNTAVVNVEAEVCQRCGERLYAPNAVRLFEEIRAKLARQETSEFIPLGRSFQVADSSTSATN